MLQSDVGREILRERPRVSSASLDLEKLRHLPAKTFGYQHWQFFRDHKVSPDTRVPVQYIADEELAYVMQRYRESHDFIHTLSGLPISVLAELGLKWFEFRQTGLPMALLGTLFGPLSLPPADLRPFYTRYLPWAEGEAKRCTSFMNVAFERHLERDIDEVRREMNLIPFSK